MAEQGVEMQLLQLQAMEAEEQVVVLLLLLLLLLPVAVAAGGSFGAAPFKLSVQ